MQFPGTGPSIEELQSISCHGCGTYEATLRQSAHPSVVSTLVKANQTARVGIWCARCRGIEAAKAIGISLIAGWWSARGPMLTIAAVQTNLRGGQQQPSTNAQMLRALARLEYDRDNREWAAMFAAEAHATQPQRENSRLADELKRGGYRATPASSPWRFAPHTVVVAFVIFSGMGLRALIGHDEVAPEAPPQRAAVAPRRTPEVSKKTSIKPYATVEELRKQLTSEYEHDLALAYFQAQLKQARADLAPSVRRGDSLMTIRYSIADLGTHPGVAPLLNQPGLKTSFENLTSVLDEATRYYNGGAPVEMMERTAGESIDVTVDIAFSAIVSDIQGNTERASALSNVVDARAQSLAEMKRDLMIRGAVITQTTKAIDACLAVAH